MRTKLTIGAIALSAVIAAAALVVLATIEPWFVQIGYGRARWYSYDWIDNDGRPSADHIVSELEDLEVGGHDPIHSWHGAACQRDGASPLDRVCRRRGHVVLRALQHGRRPHSLGESLEGCLEGHPGIVVLDPDLRPGRIPNGAEMLRGIKKRAETAAAESLRESQVGSGR